MCGGVPDEHVTLIAFICEWVVTGISRTELSRLSPIMLEGLLRKSIARTSWVTRTVSTRSLSKKIRRFWSDSVVQISIVPVTSQVNVKVSPEHAWLRPVVSSDDSKCCTSQETISCEFQWISVWRCPHNGCRIYFLLEVKLMKHSTSLCTRHFWMNESVNIVMLHITTIRI